MKLKKIDENEADYPKSHRKKPVIVMRGKKCNIEAATKLMDNYIGHKKPGYDNGVWVNIESNEEATVLKLSKRFGKRNGIFQSIFLPTDRKLNELTITSNIIKDDIPQDISFPCLYFRGNENVILEVIHSLSRHHIKYSVSRMYESKQQEYCRQDNNEQQYDSVDSFTFSE